MHIRRNQAIAASLFVFFCLPVLLCPAATIQWKNIASGSWTTASNWGGGVLPTLADTVKAYRSDSGTATINVTTAGQAVTARLLIKGGTATLNINSACDLLSGGPIEIYQGVAATVNVNGTLNGTSTLGLGGGGAADTINVYGLLNLHNDTNSAILTMGYSANGSATLNIYSGGIANIDGYTWSGACTSMIDIKTGGTLNLKGDVRTQVNTDIATGHIVADGGVGNVIATYDGTKTILQPGAMNSIVPGEFIIDPATIHCLGFRWYVTGDDNGNATVQVTYKKTGTEQWKQAINMLRVNREQVDRDVLPYTCENLFAGSVLGLEPATSYDVNFVMLDPDGGQATQSVTVQTLSVPTAPSPIRTLHVYPPGWSDEKISPSYDSISSAFAAVQPGDEILLYPGVHTGNVILSVIATENAPVVIKSAGPDQAVISGNDTLNSGKNITVTGSEYVFIEDITIQGGMFGIFGGNTNTPSGTKNLVVRNCRIINPGTGIYGWSQGSKNWYIADNTIIGRNPYWYPRVTSPDFDDGIRVYGQGNIVCYNHIEKFWDCLGVANIYPPDPSRQLKCVSIDFYGNDLSQARDDLIETDFSCYNVRVWGNRLRDSENAISCQPNYGGPVYLFRNDIAGQTQSPFKLHNWPTGLYIFNNTSIIDAEGWSCDPIWQNATLRNNLILGTKNYSMETGSPDSRTTLDYDGYRKTDDPDRFIKWYLAGDWSGAFLKAATLADFYTSLGFEQHGIMVDFDAFIKCPTPVVGQTHFVSDYDLRLLADSSPVDKGLVIPTISENYNGSSPDIGCYEYGQPLPHYGPRTSSSCNYLSGDINIDNVVDLTDMGILTSQWLQTSCSAGNDWCSGADIDNNGQVDFIDYAKMTQNWMATGNCAPSVYAGLDLVTYVSDANLSAIVTDDGLPNPPAAVATHWSLQSGPFGVIFDDANSISTAVTLGGYGVYVLRLTVDDGQLTSYDDVTVTFDSPPQWSDTANYYVNGGTGNDTNPGTSGSPFKTITKALSVAGSGKILVWGGQTYNEALVFASSGTTLKRDPASGEAIINAGSAVDVVNSYKGNCTIDGFTLTGGLNGVELVNSAATGWIIKNCRIKYNTNNGVLFNKAANDTVNNCAIYLNASGGSYSGVYAMQTGATGHTVTQSTIYGQFYGVYANTGNATITTLRDCIITGSLSSSVKAGSGCTISPITYCDVTGGTSGVTLGTGCKTGDSKLHDAVNGDFTLDSGSAAHPSSDGGDMGYRYSSSAL